MITIALKKNLRISLIVASFFFSFSVTFALALTCYRQSRPNNDSPLNLQVLDREVNHVSTSLTNLERKLAGAADGVGEGSVLDQLDAVRCQLVQLRDKGREGVGEVLETAATCKR